MCLTEHSTCDLLVAVILIKDWAALVVNMGSTSDVALGSLALAQCRVLLAIVSVVGTSRPRFAFGLYVITGKR